MALARRRGVRVQGVAWHQQCVGVTMHLKHRHNGSVRASVAKTHIDSHGIRESVLGILLVEQGGEQVLHEREPTQLLQCDVSGRRQVDLPILKRLQRLVWREPVELCDFALCKATQLATDPQRRGYLHTPSSAIWGETRRGTT